MRGSFVIGWILTVLQLSLRLGWSVVAVVFALSLHLNSVEIGAVLFLFYLGYTLSSTLWGMFIDRVGARVTLFISAFLSGLLLPLILIVHDVLPIYLLYFTEGLLTAGIYPSAVKVVSSLRNNDETPLTSYLALLDSAFPFVTLVISLLSGLILMYWQAYYIVLSVGFVVGGLAATFLKTGSSGYTGFGKVLLNRRVILMSMIRFGEQWGLVGTSSWLFPFLVLYDGISLKLSEELFLLFGVGQFLSTIIISYLSRYVNDVWLVRVALAVFIALTIAFPLVKADVILLPLSLFLGIFSFAHRPPTDSLVVRVMGGKYAGTSMGFANAVSQVGSMIAPLIVGEIISLGFPLLAIISLALGPLISLILTIISIRA